MIIIIIITTTKRRKKSSPGVGIKTTVTATTTTAATFQALREGEIIIILISPLTRFIGAVVYTKYIVRNEPMREIFFSYTVHKKVYARAYTKRSVFLALLQWPQKQREGDDNHVTHTTVRSFCSRV